MARAKNQSFSKGASLHARRTVAYVVLILLSVLCLIWFYLLFINASRSHSELMSGFTMIPSKYLGKNLHSIVYNSTRNVFKGMRNSFIIAGCSAVLCTYFSAMTAYAIHAYDFKAKKAIYAFILAVMMIPSQVTVLGFLEMIDKVGLSESYIPLIVPAIAAPVTFFFMKQYMDSVLPLSIIEASRIDGAGEFRTFNQVILPIMKPAIAVQAIFTFVQNWNNYFVPSLVLVKNNNTKTLPILIALMQADDYANRDFGAVYMFIFMSILPVIIVYIALSKFIVGGVAMGSVKG